MYAKSSSSLEEIQEHLSKQKTFLCQFIQVRKAIFDMKTAKSSFNGTDSGSQITTFVILIINFSHVS